jgi:formate hydrogenlyase subunit 3/multisubunit Na+/H+ antiporter MnhD subunit
MLLGGFPFSVWVTAVTRQARLSALPLVLAIIQTGIVFFLFMFLNTAPVLGRGEPFRQLMQWSAAATTLLAALLLQRAADWREVIGHLVLLDMGLMLLTLAVPNPDTVQAAFWLLAGRFFSLMLACIGLSLWQRQGATGGFVVDANNGRLAPWPMGLLIYGCLSLLGLPLTPGFSGHWLVLTRTTSGASWLAVVVFLALALAALALARRAWASLPWLLSPTEPDSESRRMKWLVGAAVFVALLLTFFPSFLGRYITQIANSLQ